MNFYQKTVAAITLAVVGMTVAIIGVCFATPYSDIFITECIMILFAELFLGILFINQLSKSDSILPYSLSSIWTGLFYLLFVFFMIIPACTGMRLKYFILIHAIGLVSTIIIFALAGLGEHNIKEQDTADKRKLSSKKSFYLLMSGILDDFNLTFPAEVTLRQESRKMLDNLRYSSESKAGMEDVDYSIIDALTQMKCAVSSSDAEGYRKALNLLKNLYHAREEKSKLY